MVSMVVIHIKDDSAAKMDQEVPSKERYQAYDDELFDEESEEV